MQMNRTLTMDTILEYCRPAVRTRMKAGSREARLILSTP